MGMIKNFLLSKIASAAAGECFVIGVKLADTEAHAIRLFGFLLFLISAVLLIHEWRHKASSETVSIVSRPFNPVAARGKRNCKNSRSRAPHTR